MHWHAGLTVIFYSAYAYDFHWVFPGHEVTVFLFLCSYILHDETLLLGNNWFLFGISSWNSARLCCRWSAVFASKPLNSAECWSTALLEAHWIKLSTTDSIWRTSGKCWKPRNLWPMWLHRQLWALLRDPVIFKDSSDIPAWSRALVSSAGARTA